MKSKKNKILIILAALIIARIIIVIWESNKKPDHTEAAALNTQPAQLNDLNPDANLSKAPEEAVTAQNPANTSRNEMCQIMLGHYKNIDEVKKIEKVSVRFLNIHKKVDGIVYRTRFFYKDSAENEIPTYLLYKEDQNDEEHLIEKTSYKKGPQFLKIEKAQGEIIYTEEGMNIGTDQDMFLHYENKILKDLQGVRPTPEAKDFIECRY